MKKVTRVPMTKVTKVPDEVPNVNVVDQVAA